MNKLSYDTEEKELICEYFDHLSSIVEVNLSQELNKWLYGSALSTLLKVSKKQAIIKEKQAKILKQPCHGCKVILETKILNKQTGIPENWIIAKCKQCGALNLLVLGNDVKELRIINYEPIEFLNASSYTLEEVLRKFNQYGTSS